MPTRLLAFIACALWLMGAQAATAADAPATATAAAPIPTADITARADTDEQFVQAAMRRTAAPEELQRSKDVLARQSAAVEQLSALSSGTDLTALPVRRLESLQRHWQLYAREIADGRARLSRTTHAHAEDAASLAARRAAWQATRAGSSELAPALLQRIDELIAQIEQAEQRVAQPLAELLDLGRKASVLAAEVESGQTAVLTQVEELDRRLLSMDSPALWQGAAAGQAAETANVSLRKSLAIETAFARDHDAANAPVLRVLVAVGLALLPLLFWLRHRAGQLIAQGHASAASLQALTRPWAAWLVLLALGAVVFDFQGPAIRQQAAMLLAWVPVLRLLPERILQAVGPWAYLSAVFYFLNVLASLLLGNEFLYRSMLLAMDLAMAGTLVWLVARARRAAGTAAVPSSPAPMIYLLGAASAVLAAAAVSNLLGNLSL